MLFCGSCNDENVIVCARASILRIDSKVKPGLYHSVFNDNCSTYRHDFCNTSRNIIKSKCLLGFLEKKTHLKDNFKST